MLIDDEIKKEISRLQTEISVLDKEIFKLETRLNELIGRKKQATHDLSILRSAFLPEEKKDKQKTLFYIKK